MAHAAPTERAVLVLGADPALMDAVLGDLAEEYALRAARDGAGAARRWYAREVLRSVPPLVRSTVEHVIRRGSPRQRARLAAALAAVALTSSAVVAAVLTRAGPPARLVAGIGEHSAGAADDGLVVNSLRPVRLSVRVLDAAGRRLKRDDVRFAWESGVPVPVTPTGAVTCTRPGDAVVRAALGALVTHVVLHCQPVREVRATMSGEFVLGDPPRDLSLDAVGVDGRPVTQLVARMRVEDSTIATLDGGHVRPLRPGRTGIDVGVGDRATGVGVTVYAPVRTFEGLRPDQQFVAAPVRLASGASVQWALPTGLFWLAFTPDSAARVRPVLTAGGPVLCMPALGPRVDNTHCLARGPGATVTVAYPGQTRPGPGMPEVVGTLALERQENPERSDVRKPEASPP